MDVCGCSMYGCMVSCVCCVHVRTYVGTYVCMYVCTYVYVFMYAIASVSVGGDCVDVIQNKRESPTQQSTTQHDYTIHTTTV